MGIQKYYLQQNVFDAAKERIRWVFSEFEHVYVSFSGGKDSTVVLNLALQVAEEMGRLPVRVMFTDQEAEWQHVIDYIRTVMSDPRVSPRWLQIPIKLFNATSRDEPWLYCWKPGAEWIREKEPDSIHRNVYGTDRFKQLFTAFLRYHHPTKPACSIGGVRCEESPARALGLTTYEAYKGVTWGKADDARRRHFVFYPIYDWTTPDVWKAIHDHGWPYTKLYDLMYQYGVPLRNMRVSNVHHETAVRSLFVLQEIEPDTWDKITTRLKGINTAGQLQRDFYQPRTLPFMFKDWWEYREHLLANLVTDPKDRAKFRHQFEMQDRQYRVLPDVMDDLVSMQISAILVNDLELTKWETFTASHHWRLQRYREEQAEAANAGS